MNIIGFARDCKQNYVKELYISDRESMKHITSNSIVHISSFILEEKITLKNLDNVMIIGDNDVEITLSHKSTIKFKDCNNIIISGLTIKSIAKGDRDGSINLQLVNCHHCVVDHCTFIDTEDEQLCIKDGSDYISVQYCIFKFTSLYYHAFAVLIGKQQDDIPSSGYFHVTFYRCVFDGGTGRFPRTRHTIVHLLNCLYKGKAHIRPYDFEQSEVWIEKSLCNEISKDIFTVMKSATYVDSDDELHKPPYDYELINTNKLKDYYDKQRIN